MQAHERVTADLTRSTAASEPADARGAATPSARIQVRYDEEHQAHPAGLSLLAAVRFGASPPACGEAGLTIDVALEPLPGSPCVERWLAQGAVHAGRSGRVRYAHDDHHLFALVEADERSHGGIRATAASVYNELQAFQRNTPFRHPLRIWNYLDAINEGPGDLERYREFCVGRAHGLLDVASERFPAATAIGRQRETGVLQVFWLAGRSEGVPVENPRQVSAYRYPRAHGPVSPSFARATVAPDGAVLISGTASIVGHASQHLDDPQAQLEETIRNLDALAAHAAGARSQGRKQLLKAYVRNPAHARAVEARLRETYAGCEVMLLAADICRRELLLEIEGVELSTK